jgi:hypothetical protein
LQIGRRFRLGQQETTGGEIQPGETVSAPAAAHGSDQVVAPCLEQRLVGERAGRDDAHHLALDRTLAGGRIADLLAQRHRHAGAHQSRQVLFRRVIGHTGHRNALAGRLAARGQRDVEQLRRTSRIVEEQLVEITHPVKEQQPGMLRLDAEVLLHDRGV